MFRKILVANDGSEGAGGAVSAAIKIAKADDAELHMISVEELPAFPASIDEVVEEKQDADHFYAAIVRRASAQAQAEGRKLHAHILSGHPVQVICEFVAREGIDLLVVGYMGHTALYNRLIGSTTERLVEHAPCAVMVIK
jgi:nucleotide-binding universal stress UspA family protein